MNRIVIIVCEDSSTVHELTEYEDCHSPIGGAHVEVPIMFSNVGHILPVTVPPVLLVQRHCASHALLQCYEHAARMKLRAVNIGGHV